MTNTTVDRFQVLSYNELTYPHKCGTCGSFSGDNGKQYIDFGLFVEFYGNVYICTECFFGAIQSSKQLSSWFMDKIDESVVRIRELQAVVTTLINENRTLRDGLDSLRDSIISSTNSDSNHINVATDQDLEGRSDRRSEEPEVSSTDPTRLNPVGEAREARPVEQINVEGSTHVRTDDSSDSPVIGLDTFNL